MQNIIYLQKMIKGIKSFLGFKIQIPSFQLHLGSVIIGMLLMFILSLTFKGKPEVIYISKVYTNNIDRLLTR